MKTNAAKALEITNKGIYSDEELDFFKFVACQKGNDYLFYNFSNYSEDENGRYADNYEDKNNSDYYITASLDFSSIELTKIYDAREGIEEKIIPLTDSLNRGLCIGALLLAKERRESND